MCESYGTPSRGLMQVIPVSFHETDPEYYGRWTEPLPGEICARPRQGGKATAIERAIAIAETVKPRPEMAEIMERAMAMPGGPVHYASGGVVPSPTGRIKTFMSPGEWVMTPEMARAKAEEVLRRTTGDYYTTEERAAMDEIIRAQFEEPPDDYPEPPQLPVW